MIQDLMLEPSATAQWKKTLQLASQQCHCQLHEDLESYLIFTLVRFTRDATLTHAPLGIKLLNCHQLHGHAKQNELRDVGDQCLLLSGLFPQLADKRSLRLSYYVDLGITAYQHLSAQLKRSFANLYQLLSQHFVQLMDVLQSIRSSTAMPPLQSLELWQDTGSSLALNRVNNITKSTPFLIDQRIHH